MVTQKDVAELAGVSFITVSRVINGESNVKEETRRKVQEAMRNLMKDKTCFVIAHRLSTIRNADLILVMRDGDIVEQGTHTELLARGGFYSELYNSQFDNQE